MPWEVGGGDPDSEENIPTFWDTVLKEQKDETMLLVDCPNCNKRLRVPETYSGRITCANCKKVFERQNKQNQNNLYDSKGRLMVLTNAQRRAGMTPSKAAARFAIGGGLELLISAIIWFLIVIYMISSW